LWKRLSLQLGWAGLFSPEVQLGWLMQQRGNELQSFPAQCPAEQFHVKPAYTRSYLAVTTASTCRHETFLPEDLQHHEPRLEWTPTFQGQLLWQQSVVQMEDGPSGLGNQEA